MSTGPDEQSSQGGNVSAAAVGTIFVLHGKHRAPLISYPKPNEIASLIDIPEGSI